VHSGANLLGDGFGGGSVELPVEVQEGQAVHECPHGALAIASGSADGSACRTMELRYSVMALTAATRSGVFGSQGSANIARNNPGRESANCTYATAMSARSSGVFGAGCAAANAVASCR
jgi:hypothetical protein